MPWRSARSEPRPSVLLFDLELVHRRGAAPFDLAVEAELGVVTRALELRDVAVEVDGATEVRTDGAVGVELFA
jgi:hypothetical protein